MNTLIMSTCKAKTMEAFHHTPLSIPNSIRLISLLPSQGLQNPLELTLSTICLDEATNKEHSYEALSYVWGARNGSRPTECMGKVLPVTPNCESALRHLRLKNKARTLWIDAICIDQEVNVESTEERNVQVELMGKIYQKAFRTLCWLGEANDYTAELMAHLSRIGNCPSQRGLKRFLLFDEKLRQEGIIDLDSSSLNHLMSHPWHSRIWTVQEAAYSQDCLVVCGNSTITWENYATATKYLVFDEWIDGLDGQTHKSCASIDMRDGIRNYIRKTESSLPETDLSLEEKQGEQAQTVEFLTSYLAGINQLQATDQKDKIYGLQALYTGLGIPLPAVDYTKPLSQIYEEAAVAMIAWSGTLKVLGDASHSHRDASFPSWVPNWSDDTLRIFTPDGDATSGSKISQPSTDTLNTNSGELHLRGKIIGRILAWRKSRTCEAVFPSRLNQCELQLKGHIDGLGDDTETACLAIGRVRFFRQLYNLLKTDTQLCPYDSDNLLADILYQSSYSEVNKSLNVLLDILQYPDTKYDLGFGEILVERWKTASGSLTPDWTPESTSCAVIMAALLMNAVRDEHHQNIDTRQILTLIAELTMRLNDKTLILAYLDCPRYEHSAQEFLPRKVIVLGTAPQAVMAGDSIVLLEGADWPVVLRPAGTKWHFIGPAYLTDTMDCEAWTDGNGQVDGLCDFTLV